MEIFGMTGVYVIEIVMTCIVFGVLFFYIKLALNIEKIKEMKQNVKESIINTHSLKKDIVLYNDCEQEKYIETIEKIVTNTHTSKYIKDIFILSIINTSKEYITKRISDILITEGGIESVVTANNFCNRLEEFRCNWNQNNAC